MKPYNPGGHSAYQDRVLAQLRKYYPDAVSSLPASTWAVMEKFWKFELHPPKDMAPCKRLYEIFKVLFLNQSVNNGLIDLLNLSPAGDGPPVYTAAQERKKRTCSCLKNGIRDCRCDRACSQPDCNIGWDSHRECYYFGYDLYMLTASDSENDLPVFPFLGPASRHDSIGFLYNWFSMKQSLSEANVTKLLLDSAHDAMPYYEYCRGHGIVPFIDLNAGRGRPPVYKNDFTINDDGVPVCREGHAMRRDGTESAKGRTKFKCPKISFAGDSVTCTCDNPCSDAKYGRTVHLVMKDNPRLFNDPPRSSKEWKMIYNARTSAERCNKRGKVDYKLEDGRYRSSKMWYCRLFAIMMCQHLDAWALPETPRLKDVL